MDSHKSGKIFTFGVIYTLFRFKKNNNNLFRKEEKVLFIDTLNTFYLWLYSVGCMVKDHSDCKKGNLLPLHELLFLISSEGSSICTIQQTGQHIPWPLLHQLWSTGWNKQ